MNATECYIISSSWDVIGGVIEFIISHFPHIPVMKDLRIQRKKIKKIYAKSPQLHCKLLQEHF